MPDCNPECPRKENGGCYSNHGCRCDICKAANARRVRRRRNERKSETVKGDHGKDSTYVNWNCRCIPCTEDHARKAAKRRANSNKAHDVVREARRLV